MEIGFIVLLCTLAVVGFFKVYFHNQLHGRDHQVFSARRKYPEEIASHARTCELGPFEKTLAGYDQASGLDITRELRRFSAVLAANTESWFLVPEQLHAPWRDLVRSHADYHRLTEALLGKGAEFQTQPSSHLTEADTQSACRRYDAAYSDMFGERPAVAASARREVSDLYILRAKHGRFKRVFRRDGEKVDRSLGSNEFT